MVSLLWNNSRKIAAGLRGSDVPRQHLNPLQINSLSEVSTALPIGNWSYAATDIEQFWIGLPLSILTEPFGQYRYAAAQTRGADFGRRIVCLTFAKGGLHGRKRSGCPNRSD
jgi:hypothetical protein